MILEFFYSLNLSTANYQNKALYCCNASTACCWELYCQHRATRLSNTYVYITSKTQFLYIPCCWDLSHYPHALFQLSKLSLHQQASVSCLLWSIYCQQGVVKVLPVTETGWPQECSQDHHQTAGELGATGSRYVNTTSKWTTFCCSFLFVSASSSHL